MSDKKDIRKNIMEKLEHDPHLHMGILKVLVNEALAARDKESIQRMYAKIAIKHYQEYKA